MCQKTALFVAGAEEGGGVEEKEAEALGEAAAGAAKWGEDGAVLIHGRGGGDAGGTIEICEARE